MPPAPSAAVGVTREGLSRFAVDVFIADDGDEHVAHPIGDARILVVEKHGSI